MKLRIFLALAFPILLASGAASGCDTSTGVTRCSRPDAGTPCAIGNTAERIGTDGWRVSLRQTVVSEVAYNDGGFVCSYTNTRCVIGGECNFFGAATWTSARAISECLARN